MNLLTSQPPDTAANNSSLEIRHILRVLDRKDWWHWWNTIVVIMLLMGAILALSLPKIPGENDFTYQLQLSQAVRGLLGVVLIFNIYTLYQQHLLRQLRNHHISRQIEDAMEQRVRAEAYYELAILDHLTGLHNRRFIEEHLRAEIARAKRRGDPLIVLMLDLDNFKGINDRFGHSAGDLVLKEFARRLTKAIRGSDIAVRLGGDEFLVVLPECPPEKMEVVLSRLKDFEIEMGQDRIPVSSSRGWAQYQATDTAEELIKRADEALYAHKASQFTFGRQP
jgi:two-component system, cell cycle response regulator